MTRDEVKDILDKAKGQARIDFIVRTLQKGGQPSKWVQEIEAERNKAVKSPQNKVLKSEETK
jgi:hypothetical protein